MKNNEIIRIENLSKNFTLYHEKKTSAVDYLISFFSHNDRMRKYETICVLKNINLSIKRGECLGIIGRNGSGKTTLLRTIAGIIHPSEGNVKVKGSILPFIELGVGFNPELTGKENIYLYGSLLGLSREEIEEKIEGIIEFSGLQNFIDTKLKNYSSGMHARLSFSTALMNEPDIILVDEVLAVGDNSFQKRCLLKMIEFKKEGKTIVFVSHSLEQVKEICDRAVLLDKGSILMYGKASDIINAYIKNIFEEDKAELERRIKDEKAILKDYIKRRYALAVIIKKNLPGLRPEKLKSEYERMISEIKQIKSLIQELYEELKSFESKVEEPEKKIMRKIIKKEEKKSVKAKENAPKKEIPMAHNRENKKLNAPHTGGGFEDMLSKATDVNDKIRIIKD
ncbi:MAG: ABC transporter ATP-binding protein, partial [Candidatus Woesearchaeota archaeon]|nr:ABC transporter ATP-binding protein [Candidatus Woesearchaeota archaeon]